MSLLDDLRNLDPNNIAAWPFPIKLAGIGVVCVLLLFLGYWLVVADELEGYSQAQAKEEQLKQAYMDKKGMAINLPAYKQQMEEMRQAFGTLLRQLPNKTEVPNLLIDITQAGLGRGLDFILFKPEREAPKEFYAELPISIKVTGHYHEIGRFVSDIASLPRIVTIGDLDIGVEAKTQRLIMSASARTYRYLEADEIAEQARKTKPGAPAGGARR